jgi:hypothetical protein
MSQDSNGNEHTYKVTTGDADYDVVADGFYTGRDAPEGFIYFYRGAAPEDGQRQVVAAFSQARLEAIELQNPEPAT